MIRLGYWLSIDAATYINLTLDKNYNFLIFRNW
jgi:hypothetical protein